MHDEIVKALELYDSSLCSNTLGHCSGSLRAWHNRACRIWLDSPERSRLVARDSVNSVRPAVALQGLGPVGLWRGPGGVKVRMIVFPRHRYTRLANLGYFARGWRVYCAFYRESKCHGRCRTLVFNNLIFVERRTCGGSVLELKGHVRLVYNFQKDHVYGWVSRLIPITILT